MRMILGSIDTAAAHYVSANGILVQMREFSNNFVEFEAPFRTGETISRLENLFVNVQGRTSRDFDS
jgi:hypothetical protein